MRFIVLTMQCGCLTYWGSRMNAVCISLLWAHPQAAVVLHEEEPASSLGWSLLRICFHITAKCVQTEEWGRDTIHVPCACLPVQEAWITQSWSLAATATWSLWCDRLTRRAFWSGGWSQQPQSTSPSRKGTSCWALMALTSPTMALCPSEAESASASTIWSPKSTQMKRWGFL